MSYYFYSNLREEGQSILFKFNKEKPGLVNYLFIKHVLCARSQNFWRTPKNQQTVSIHWEFRAKLEREKTEKLRVSQSMF